MVTKIPGWDLKGLSTDTKPLDAPNGSTFLEMNTGDVYMFNEAAKTWVKL